MHVTLNYMGQLRHIAGIEQERKEYAEPTSLVDVLRDAAGCYDTGFANLLFGDDGGLRPSVMVLINDAPISRGSPPPLSDGDQVTLFTAIAGG